jgi:hypothetical protein
MITGFNNYSVLLKEYYQKVAVAALDICGMKKMLGRDDKCYSAIHTLSLFIKNASVDTFFPVKSQQDEGQKVYQYSVFFGDSVYFFSDPKLDIQKQVDLLAGKCAALIAIGFCNGFLLRAGIGVGDLVLGDVILFDDRKIETRIGNSMAKAHSIQECQKWLGGAVETNIPKSPKDINRISYDVPTKEKSEFFTSKLEAINWVYVLARGINNKSKTKSEIIDLIEKRISNIDNSDSEEIKQKLLNTTRFVEYVFSQPKYIPIDN